MNTGMIFLTLKNIPGKQGHCRYVIERIIS